MDLKSMQVKSDLTVNAWMRTEIDLNESEIDLNECEHFLNAKRTNNTNCFNMNY